MKAVTRLARRPRLLGVVAVGVLALSRLVLCADVASAHDKSDARLKRDIRPL